MAEATQQLARVLDWRAGAFLGLTPVLGVFTTVGWMVGLVGAWAVIFIWAVSMLLAVAQAFLYAEMATMFPDQTGGVAAYAHEGLRRYTVFVGPVAMWGYWLGWTLIQAVIAFILGSIIQEMWFTGQTWTVALPGFEFGFAHVVGGVALLSAFLLNAFGIKLAARLTSFGVSVFALVAAVMVVLPFATASWDASLLSWRLDDPGLAIVLIYLACWTCFAVEGPSLFATEYRDPETDTPKAIKACAVVMVATFTMVPFATAGAVGEEAIGANPNGYAVDLLASYWEGSVTLVIAILVLGLWVTLIATSAQAARALLGLARCDATIKQFAVLNRHGMPGRALGLDLATNTFILFVIGNTVAIIAASNIGYVLCCAFACFGFLALRRDRPDWPRPFRLPDVWVPIALVLGVVNLFIAAYGVSNPGLAGYGGLKETVISLALLFVCIPLFLYRRLWQDRGTPFQWREKTPLTPTDPSAHIADEFAASALAPTDRDDAPEGEPVP